MESGLAGAGNEFFGNAPTVDPPCTGSTPDDIQVRMSMTDTDKRRINVALRTGYRLQPFMKYAISLDGYVFFDFAGNSNDPTPTYAADGKFGLVEFYTTGTLLHRRSYAWRTRPTLSRCGSTSQSRRRAAPPRRPSFRRTAAPPRPGRSRARKTDFPASSSLMRRSRRRRGTLCSSRRLAWKTWTRTPGRGSTAPRSSPSIRHHATTSLRVSPIASSRIAYSSTEALSLVGKNRRGCRG